MVAAAACSVDSKFVSTDRSFEKEFGELRNQIEALSTEVKRHRRSGRKNHVERRKSREHSFSRGCSNEKTHDLYYRYYHDHFGENARHCRKLCSWRCDSSFKVNSQAFVKSAENQ